MAPSAMTALSQATNPSQAAGASSPNLLSFLMLLMSYMAGPFLAERGDGGIIGRGRLAVPPGSLPAGAVAVRIGWAGGPRPALPSREPNPMPPSADLLVRRLSELGVQHVFGYPGGQLTPVYDALYRTPAVRHVLARHEQAAGFMADGYARATGRP